MKQEKITVFIPRDGNHWDSLDSIWREKREAGEKVIVIQPPFYRYEDDREELVEYEIAGYPGMVEVYPYDAIDLEALHPACIYINDPGDGYRDGTRVHPFFGAENLKQYTEKLVYVPYYYLQEPLLHDRNQIAEMQKDILVPSLVHADEIQVQSENMREAYIMLATALQGLDTKESWEAKLKGTGDGKIKWLTRSKEEIGSVSDGLLQCIQKEDGTFKKVILQDVTVMSLLCEKRKLLHKIKSNLEKFQRLEEEVVYWLKLEPDTEEILASMNGDMAHLLQEIKEAFEQSANGIYDNSPWRARAMALCDGYYGEPGEIAATLDAAGKPVMIEDLDQEEPEQLVMDTLFGEQTCIG